jgi:hypothetical protein
MENSKSSRGLEAGPGERMIEVKIRFWTNNIADGKGRVRPKHAWPSGAVRMQPNKTHGIKGRKPVVFHSIMELPAVIERVLINNGIVLHLSSRSKLYAVSTRDAGPGSAD